MKRIVAFVVCALAIVAMSANIYAMDLMKSGNTGDDVRDVQEMLIARGYLEENDADGSFGPRTEQAVLAFQQDNGLDATGMVGSATYEALKGDTDAAATDTASAADLEQAKEPAKEIDFAKTFPSWDPDSAALASLVDFAAACTDEASPDYLEPADRIATFDMDGTILCEKAPVYLDYCMTMYRVLDDQSYHATEEEREAMEEVRYHAYTFGEKYDPETITKNDLVASAFAGMTPAEFRAYVLNFAGTVDAVGFEGMKYGESFYKPMLEVIAFLKANDFDVCIVSASEREVTRALVEQFNIPLDHVIATDVPYLPSGIKDVPVDEYNMSQDETIQLGAPLDPVECGLSNKPASIMREIGKRPVLAFGNSSGDFSMLNFAQGNPDHPGMGFFVICDDTVREYGNEEKAAEYYTEVEKEGWTAISMANDWKNIYGEGVQKTSLPGVEEEQADAA